MKHVSQYRINKTNREFRKRRPEEPDLAVLMGEKIDIYAHD